MEKTQLVRGQACSFVHSGKEFQLYVEYDGNALEDFEEPNTVILIQAIVASEPLSLLVATTHPSVISPSVLL